jgi:hypothetical protein
MKIIFILLLFSIIIGVIISLKYYIFSKRERIALIFVVSKILNTTINEDMLITSSQKFILNNVLGIFFPENKIVSFGDIKRLKKLYYIPPIDPNIFFVLYFNIKNEIVDYDIIKSNNNFKTINNSILIPVYDENLKIEK